MDKKFKVSPKDWTPELLREYRKYVDLSQNKFGNSLGLRSGYAFVDQLENGKGDLEGFVDKIFYVHFQGGDPKNFEKIMDERWASYLENLNDVIF
jgi:hypothetical protein